MSIHAISADEQLTVHYGPGVWRLHGPDDRPVFEARPHIVYYHPLFGRWRDLPPGDRMSVDGVESVQVRWDGGWAVGVTLAPNGLWRRLVRFPDSRQIARADEIARALSTLIGRPLKSEPVSAEAEPVTRVTFSAPAQEAPPALAEEPPESPPPPLEEPTAPPIVTVQDAANVRLPLRLGGGAQLDRDEHDRLILSLPAAASRLSSLVITLVGLVALGVFVGVLLLIRSGLPGVNPLVGLALSGSALLVVGFGGLWLLTQLNPQSARTVVFDRAAGEVILPPDDPEDEMRHLPLTGIHGVRVYGEAVREHGKLAYRRTVSLMLMVEDIPLFMETRPTALPADPAVMPSLAVLRRQADELAGPSLARVGARVIAWYLGVPLAGE